MDPAWMGTEIILGWISLKTSPSNVGKAQSSCWRKEKGGWNLGLDTPRLFSQGKCQRPTQKFRINWRLQHSGSSSRNSSSPAPQGQGLKLQHQDWRQHGLSPPERQIWSIRYAKYLVKNTRRKGIRNFLFFEQFSWWFFCFVFLLTWKEKCKEKAPDELKDLIRPFVQSWGQIRTPHVPGICEEMFLQPQCPPPALLLLCFYSRLQQIAPEIFIKSKFWF